MHFFVWHSVTKLVDTWRSSLMQRTIFLQRRLQQNQRHNYVAYYCIILLSVHALYPFFIMFQYRWVHIHGDVEVFHSLSLSRTWEGSTWELHACVHWNASEKKIMSNEETPISYSEERARKGGIHKPQIHGIRWGRRDELHGSLWVRFPLYFGEILMMAYKDRLPL